MPERKPNPRLADIKAKLIDLKAKTEAMRERLKPQEEKTE